MSLTPVPKKEPRRIVQIAVTPETEHSHFCYVALCNDGTLWTRIPEKTSSWEQLPEIPQ